MNALKTFFVIVFEVDQYLLIYNISFTIINLLIYAFLYRKNQNVSLRICTYMHLSTFSTLSVCQGDLYRCGIESNCSLDYIKGAALHWGLIEAVERWHRPSRECSLMDHKAAAQGNNQHRPTASHRDTILLWSILLPPITSAHCIPPSHNITMKYPVATHRRLRL